MIADPDGGKAPELIIIGTGSELSMALEAREALVREGVAVRVVSMPSWELFEEQDQTYKDSVFPEKITARIAIEQGSVMGWDRYVGRLGAIVGMHSFGASAPMKALASKFGFEPEKIVELAKKQLEKQKTTTAA